MEISIYISVSWAAKGGPYKSSTTYFCMGIILIYLSSRIKYKCPEAP